MSYIVLKFDDLKEKTCESFNMVYDYCLGKHIAVCFGLIGSSLNDKLSDEYIKSLKRMQEGGTELWNHGFVHSEQEFSQARHDRQVESIRDTQLLMDKYLGYSAATFGSPHNNSTETTVKVLRDEFPEIENYFFMADAGGLSDARQFVMRCNYEIETGSVDFDYFKHEYERIRKYPYFVMQGHPSFWKPDDFERFKKILDMLLSDGNTFVTAKELSQIDISGFKHELSKRWEEDLSAFFVANEKVVLYGAGEIGREVYSFMRMKHIKPDAFVVSDGQKSFTEICETPVYSFTEARNYLGEFAIIPTLLGKNHKTVFDKKEFEGISIWNLQNGTYDEFIDYVRYFVSVGSWK